MKLNILEKQKPINRNKKNIFKSILKNILLSILFFACSLIMGVMILETIVFLTN